MTLIVAWVGTDDKKEGKRKASVYFASDSRYSWGRTQICDNGQKIFGASSYPEIFCFCGDVTFTSNILHQIISKIDSNLLLNKTDNKELKRSKIYSEIEASLRIYPRPQLQSITFSILHATRIENEFYLFRYFYNMQNGLKYEEISLPNISTKVYSDGSGKKEFDTEWRNYDTDRNNNHKTSRAVFKCFVNKLKTITDQSVGGLPQIMGLYRIGNARLFGIIEDGKMYIHGKEVSEYIDTSKIEWRNRDFERMDDETLERIKGAQIQPL